MSNIIILLYCNNQLFTTLKIPILNEKPLAQAVKFAGRIPFNVHHTDVNSEALNKPTNSVN
jgi:hypothetical protein